MEVNGDQKKENQSYRTRTTWRWVNNRIELTCLGKLFLSNIFRYFQVSHDSPLAAVCSHCRTKSNKMSVPPRSPDSFCVFLHDSGRNGSTKPDFHTQNRHQINPTEYTRRQTRCTQQNGYKIPCKTLHAQSAILLHPKLRRLTEKNNSVSHKLGSCMVKFVPIPRPSPCRWASAARRGWWTRTRAGLADPRSGKRAAVWERPAPAPWTTVYSFYSINLSDPLTITHKTATDLMEEGGWSWKMRKNNGIEELQRGEAEAGVCVFSRCLSAPFTTWRTLKLLSRLRSSLLPHTLSWTRSSAIPARLVHAVTIHARAHVHMPTLYTNYI